MRPGASLCATYPFLSEHEGAIDAFFVSNDVFSLRDFHVMRKISEWPGFADLPGEVQDKLRLRQCAAPPPGAPPASANAGTRRAAAIPPRPPAAVAAPTSDRAARSILSGAYSALSNTPPTPQGGPRANLARGAPGAASPVSIQRDLERARTLAIIGTAPRSFGAWRAALRAWMLFAKRRLHKDGCAALPPSSEELCLFALEFRNSRTFGNYKCQLAKACRLLGRDTAVFRDPVACRARKTIVKRHPIRRATKPFAMLSDLPAMLDFVREDRSLHALFVLAWGFALRVPSEALLIERGDPRVGARFQFSDSDLRNPVARVVLFLTTDTATLHFSRRKNRDGPTVAWRTCWCASSPATCAVHAARPFVEEIRVGEPAFLHLRRISSQSRVTGRFNHAGHQGRGDTRQRPRRVVVHQQGLSAGAR